MRARGKWLVPLASVALAACGAVESSRTPGPVGVRLESCEGFEGGIRGRLVLVNVLAWVGTSARTVKVRFPLGDTLVLHMTEPARRAPFMSGEDLHVGRHVIAIGQEGEVLLDGREVPFDVRPVHVYADGSPGRELDVGSLAALDATDRTYRPEIYLTAGPAFVHVRRFRLCGLGDMGPARGLIEGQGEDVRAD